MNAALLQLSIKKKGLLQLKEDLGKYGITLEELGKTGWTINDANNILLGVQKIAEHLPEYLSLSPTERFRSFFGNLTFELRTDITFFGITSPGKIEFRAGFVTPRLLAHEMGHMIDLIIWNKDGQKYSNNNPVNIISSQGIKDINGNLITGLGDRYAGRNAPENGYLSDSYLDEGQYHSKDVDGFWNCPQEDWADMYMNWVFNSFSDTIAGNTLSDWVSKGMPGWTNYE